MKNTLSKNNFGAKPIRKIEMCKNVVTFILFLPYFTAICCDSMAQGIMRLAYTKSEKNNNKKCEIFAVSDSCKKQGQTNKKGKNTARQKNKEKECNIKYQHLIIL